MPGVVVLYDDECGFCRWAMAWALRRSSADLVARGDRDLDAVAVVREDGSRVSGGAAFVEVLATVPRWRIVAAAGRRMPGLAEAGYRLVARNRGRLGRLLSAPKQAG